MRNNESQCEHNKIKCLQEICEKFNGTEQRIEAFCSESKLSAEEVTYLFTNNYKLC